MSSISTLSQCTYRCVVLPDTAAEALWVSDVESQCTYRCVVLPDEAYNMLLLFALLVSMHLQVRGAP